MKKVEDRILEKDDYTISRKGLENISVRKLQLEVLSIMDEVHRVCEKNNIKYCLIAGSALGIVNYKGFIPWDDDMDICILRKDWNKFIKALDKDLDDKFYYQCFEKDKKYNTIMGPTMKIRKRGTCIEETNFLLKNKCKSGNGIFLDVIIYDNICENKWIDEINRTVIKIIMPFIVLFDNLHINPIHLKKFVVWFSNKYSRRYEDSKLMSQPISVPWEKFLHEPVFLKKDILPFKKYEFEGRKFYSYNNIEKILKEWYGPNCLKKWDGKKWIETLPIEKRKPKHTVNLSFDSEKIVNKKESVIKAIIFGLILMIIALILLNQASFPLLGSGLMLIGVALLIYINKKN